MAAAALRHTSHLLNITRACTAGILRMDSHSAGCCIGPIHYAKKQTNLSATQTMLYLTKLNMLIPNHRILIHQDFKGGACCIMVIGNGIEDPSSNPGHDCLHFT